MLQCREEQEVQWALCAGIVIKGAVSPAGTKIDVESPLLTTEWGVANEATARVLYPKQTFKPTYSTVGSFQLGKAVPEVF